MTTSNANLNTQAYSTSSSMSFSPNSKVSNAANVAPFFSHIPAAPNSLLTPEDATVDLTRLSKDLKYRELFKKSPKSAFKGFSHFFLAQELDSSETMDVESISEDNSSTLTDDLDKNSIRKSSISKPHIIPHNSMGRHANFNLKFSHDGKYLASAGDDGIIRIWQVITSGTERALYDVEKNRNSYSPLVGVTGNTTFDEFESNEFGGLGGTIDSNASNNAKSGKSDRKKKKQHASLFAPVFKSKPVRQFCHSDTVIDLDWSINNFLLSSSEDHTVKLWHVDRDDCLKTFKFNSFVSAVKFYRKDDRFFASGEYDGSIKFWSILDDNVVYQRKLKNSITCLEFSPDSEEIFVGCDDGHFFAFSTVDLKQNATFQIKAKNKASRLAGIESFEHNDDIKLLITSNDSKVRLFSYSNKTLEAKFSGLDNNYSTIKASINEGHNYVISGSEDGWSYLWSVNFENLEKLSLEKQKKFNWDLKSIFKEDSCLYKNKNYGSFHAHSSRCNSAIFAPRATLKLLELSNDPIFDLKGKYGSYIDSPSSKSLTDDDLDDLSTAIIVSTDNHGMICVFRRDLSYTVRKQLQSKKVILKPDIRMRSFSMGRNRSRSFGTNSSNKGGLYTPDIVSFREADERRGRDDFNKESSLATKFSVENSKPKVPLPLALPNRGSIVKNSYSDLRSIDSALKNMLKKERSEFTEYEKIATAKSKEENDGEQDDNYTLNSESSVNELKTGKRCPYCGGDKFTAKPIDGSSHNYINFACDNCGRLVQF